MENRSFLSKKFCGSEKKFDALITEVNRRGKKVKSSLVTKPMKFYLRIPLTKCRGAIETVMFILGKSQLKNT